MPTAPPGNDALPAAALSAWTRWRRGVESVYAPPDGSPRPSTKPTMTTYGYGAALFDLDDLDLDAFIGTQAADGNGSAGCIYRNESVPGELRFEPVERFCQAQSDPAIAGYGLDLEGDGYRNCCSPSFAIELHRFHPQHEVLDLMSLLPAEHPGPECQVFGALALDLNLDGRATCSLAAEARPQPGAERATPHAPKPCLPPNGSRRAPTVEPDQLLPRRHPSQPWSLTHALGTADVDEDGLMDVMISRRRAIRSSRRYNGDRAESIIAAPRSVAGFKGSPWGKASTPMAPIWALGSTGRRPRRASLLQQPRSESTDRDRLGRGF